MVREAFAGADGTMLLTDMGAVFAFGSNANNKLGLNHRQSFLMAMKHKFNKLDVEGVSVTLGKTLVHLASKLIHCISFSFPPPV